MGTPGLTGGSLSLFTRYEASFQGGLLGNFIPSSLYMKSGTNHFLRSEPGFQRAKLSHKDTNSSLWNSVTPAQQGHKTYCFTHLNFKIINGQLG